MIFLRSSSGRIEFSLDGTERKFSSLIGIFFQLDVESKYNFIFFQKVLFSERSFAEAPIFDDLIEKTAINSRTMEKYVFFSESYISFF